MKLNLWVLAALTGGGYFYWQSRNKKVPPSAAAEAQARALNPNSLVVPLSPERAAQPAYDPNMPPAWATTTLQGYSLGAFGEQVVQAPRW